MGVGAEGRRDDMHRILPLFYPSIALKNVSVETITLFFLHLSLYIAPYIFFLIAPVVWQGISRVVRHTGARVLPGYKPTNGGGGSAPLVEARRDQSHPQSVSPSAGCGVLARREKR